MIQMVAIKKNPTVVEFVNTVVKLLPQDWQMHILRKIGDDFIRLSLDKISFNRHSYGDCLCHVYMEYVADGSSSLLINIANHPSEFNDDDDLIVSYHDAIRMLQALFA